MRIILYTGKGGVGKTSIAAATAVRCARRGYRTLVISTDAAHSLADSFDQKLGSAPVEIEENLWGQEVDVEREIDVHWGTLQAWLRTLISWRGVDEVMAEEMAVLPGMDELAGLLYLLNYYEKNQFDVVIVDCAPTGETLRLLTFPDVLRWWMRRIFPIERVASRIVRPVLLRMTDLPLPSDDVYEAIKLLFERVDKMHEILSDASVTSVRLVLNPEKMVIKEAQRSLTQLNLYGYTTDLVVCNRVLPPSAVTNYFAPWHASQERYLQQIEEGFSPLPLLTVPLFEREIVGLPLLARLAEAIYGDHDPAQVFYTGRTHSIISDNGSYILSLALPFVAREDVSLSQVGDELLVQVGSYRRNLVLPRSLIGLDATQARMEGQSLQIRFESARRN